MIDNKDMPASPIPKQYGRMGGVIDLNDPHGSGFTKREAIAIAAMQGLLSGVFADQSFEYTELAKGAVLQADALLAALEDK